VEAYIRPTNIIGVIKLKEMRYTGHVEDMYVTRNGCHILFKDLPVWEPKSTSVDKRKELKCVFVTECSNTSASFTPADTAVGKEAEGV